jgi:L-aspartate oxidase
VGVERDASGLRTLIDALGRTPPRNMLVPAMIARAALVREESRGAHYRTDFPATSEAFQGRILWRRDAVPRFEAIQ